MRFRHLSALAAAGLLAAFAAPLAASPSGVVISQIYGGGGNSSATYNRDFIELFNAGPNTANIGGWSVQYAAGPGSNWTNQTNIPTGTVLQPGQYLLIEGGGGTVGSDLPTPDVTGSINMAAGQGNVALVRSTTALAGTCPTGGDIEDFVGWGTAACHEGSGTAPRGSGNTGSSQRNDAGCADSDDNAADFSAGPVDPRNSASPTHGCGAPTDIYLSVNDVTLPEGDSGTTDFDFVVQLSLPAGPGGVSFDITTEDGTATVADDDYVANTISGATINAGEDSYVFTVLVNGDTTAEPDEVFGVRVSNITGADVVTTEATGTGTILNDDGLIQVAIHDIQGSPATQGPDGASPFVGQTLRTGGIVTVKDGSGGFYLQTPDAEADVDPLTSEGIYVFGSQAAAQVSVGDAIELDGEVSEYFGLTELSGIANLVVLSSGNALPEPVVFDATTPSPDPDNLSCGDTNFECFEGMLVTIADGLVTQGSGWSSAHAYDYLYVTASGRRSLREPGLHHGLTPVPGDNDAAGIWDGNPELFEMQPNKFPGVHDDSIAVTGGSTFTATGVIGYSFGSYEFYPSELELTEIAPVPRPVPGADGTTLRIGSFNVERYCDDIDDTGSNDTPFECAGNTPPSAAEYAQKTQRLADYVGTVLALPDVVAIQEVEKQSVLAALAAQLEADYGVHYAARLLEGNDPSGIDVGFLVNTDRVEVLAVQQLDKHLLWLTPSGNNRNVFDHPPLLLQGIFTGDGENQPFMVLNNHLKARTQVDKTDGSGNPTDQALTDQEKRLRQAYALALQVRDLQAPNSRHAAALRAHLGPAAASSPVPLAVVGDFNAYEFTDGFVDIVGMVRGEYDFDANLWDLTDLDEWSLQPVALDDENVVDPPLWNATESLPVNERYSYLFSFNLGPIQGYGIGGGSRNVPTNQILDQALLNEAARAAFVRMDYGRANQDAASEDVRNSTGPIGSSDHDGFVLQFLFGDAADDLIFADGFELAD